MRIGVDFDNTLASYDNVFGALALDQGYLESLPAGGKRGVRDTLRQAPGGERKWQRLQALAYGPRVFEAEVFSGAFGALTRWRRDGAEVHIVSHKTEYAHGAGGGVNLQRVARGWLEANGFFNLTGPGLAPERVHFRQTRAEKLEAIDCLDLQVFVDDLEEVLTAPSFPDAVFPILFDPHDVAGPNAGITRYRRWRDIEEAVDVRARA